MNYLVSFFKNFLFLFLALIVLFTDYIQAQWTSTESPPSLVNCITVSGTKIFAGDENTGVYLSTNNGDNWTQLNNGLQNTEINTLFISGTDLFAGTDEGAYLSMDDGENWSEIFAGIPNTNILAFAVLGSNLFVGTGEGIFLSTDNGSSWTESDSGYQFTPSATAFAVSGSNIFAGLGFGVYLSTDNGESWNLKNPDISASSIRSLIAVGLNIFVGTSNEGVYLSTDNGESWTEKNNGLTSEGIWDFAASGTNLFVATDDGVFLSTDNGSSWVSTDFNNDTQAWTVAVSDNYLFAAGALGGNARKRSLSELITDAELFSGKLPSEYHLEQNYPNPFNPFTEIKYQIPRSSFVNIKVYDFLGKEILELVNEEKAAGSYTVTFDAYGLSSGIYFYQLKVKNLIQTRKMILMK